MNTKIVFPAVSLILCILFTITAWFGLSRESTIIFWVGYILMIIALFIFQLSLLTPIFDLLSYAPIAATIILVITLIIFVIAGLFLRWLLDASFIYWAASAIFPLASGTLYVVDLFQQE